MTFIILNDSDSRIEFFPFHSRLPFFHFANFFFLLLFVSFALYCHLYCSSFFAFYFVEFFPLVPLFGGSDAFRTVEVMVVFVFLFLDRPANVPLEILGNVKQQVREQDLYFVIFRSEHKT